MPGHPRLYFSAPKNVDARDKPGHDELIDRACNVGRYAIVMSGKTASILVFNVAALNGLTM
jgi:hypothetical protein